MSKWGAVKEHYIDDPISPNGNCSIVLDEYRLVNSFVCSKNIILLTGNIRVPPHSIIYKLDILANLIKEELIDGLIIVCWLSDHPRYRQLIQSSQISNCSNVNLVIVSNKEFPPYFRSADFQQLAILAGLSCIEKEKRWQTAVLRVRTDKFQFTFDTIKAWLTCDKNKRLINDGRICLATKHYWKSLGWIPFFQPDGIIYASWPIFAGIGRIKQSALRGSSSMALFVGAEQTLLGGIFYDYPYFKNGYSLLRNLYPTLTRYPLNYMNYYTFERQASTEYFETLDWLVDNSRIAVTAQYLAAIHYLDSYFYVGLDNIDQFISDYYNRELYYRTSFPESPLGTFIANKLVHPDKCNDLAEIHANLEELVKNQLLLVNKGGS